MKSKRVLLFFSVIFLVCISGACLARNISLEAPNEDPPVEVFETPTPDVVPPQEEQPTSTQEDVSTGPATKRYSFDQLGISLEVPAELYVYKDPSVNYDDPGKLDGYLFYIQNYGYRGGPSSGDFQMYGLMQFRPFTFSWEEFASIQVDSPNNVYANEIEINGLRGFDTQLSGIRNRFFYHFYLEGNILSIAVAAPTEENKAKADQIISTIEFNPDKLSTASQVQQILEPNSLYQMYLPDDWNYSFNSTAGIRISDLESSSPGAEVLVEETDGPHDNIHYKNGISLSVVVLEDESAKSEPAMASIQSSYPLMISGIEGMDYLFTEPSTAEGILREIRYYYGGRSYILRFGHTADVDQELVEWIILNFMITQQEDI
ncbi:MAG: hypothetical protein V3R33_04610 [Anaerolineales bacterium]